MVFSTPIFLFAFLLPLLLIYYCVPAKLRNPVLLLFSLLFYFWGEQGYTLILLVSTAVDYIHGLLVQRYRDQNRERAAKLVVASSVFFNLAILFFFKYWDFVAAALSSVGLDVMPQLGITLPIGISFYTFQTMSYTIDVYRADAKAQKSIINFGTYVALFPQLIAGPIIKYKDLGEQLDSRKLSRDQFASGVRRFVVGLSKKLLLANNVGRLWEICRQLTAAEPTVMGAWLGALAFAFQIYFDFSGYSDMAIGLGKMFGFEFAENFNYPYISKSITEFWRRWHISLSTWLRQYLYIPLGGNRRGRGRWICNLLIVWAATGIWHGANWNYLLWGLYFFCLLLAEKLLLEKWLNRSPAAVQHFYVAVMILFSWVIFALEDFAELTNYCAVMLGQRGIPLCSEAVCYYLRNYLPVLLAAAIGSTKLPLRCWRTIKLPWGRWLEPAVIMIGLLLCTAYAVAGTYNPFLYFRL